MPDPTPVRATGAPRTSATITSLRRGPDRATRRAVSAVAVVAAAVALLQVGVFDPALAAVLSRVGGPAQAEAADDMAPVASWRWSGAARRSAGGSTPDSGPAEPDLPAEPAPAVTPVGTPPRETGRFRPPTFVPPGRAGATLEPMDDCPRPHGPNVTVPVRAVGGPGTARVTWTDLGDPALQGYQVGAAATTSEGLAEMTWTAVDAPNDCTEVAVTIRGLTSGGEYEFWLEAVTTDPQDDTRTHRRMRGRSGDVAIS